ncbi:unnamed protein product [Symbiodinium sp. CCMP2456]|nr:unnamed protein product [Symbiodinium sp. CCMP2456]
MEENAMTGELHVPESTLELHCWPSETVDISRFSRFLAWLGVLRWTEQLLNELALAPRVDTCPICYEEKLDVECLEHWSPKGDVSEHRMCGSCRLEYGQSQCPFCKEYLLKEELIDFIDKFGATIREDGRYDLFEVHAALEEWEIHEMEFEAQPSVMRRAARLLMEDRTFRERLKATVAAQRRSWLSIASGPMFRFWGFDQVKPLCSGGEVSKLLKDAVELLLDPLERARTDEVQVDQSPGFVYSQDSAVDSARNSQMAIGDAGSVSAPGSLLQL